MKRQRSMVKVAKSRDGAENHVNEVLKIGVRKRKKKVKEEEDKEVDERSSSSSSSIAMAALESSSVVGWEEEEEPWQLSSSGVVVDEQMSWGLLWFPGWDMEFMGDAYNQLYSDVVWDWEDDIWNLKSITQIPNP